jgi:hypothetical protein
VSLSNALLIDGVVLFVCAAVLLRDRDARHSHPATIYLAFHLLVMTLRGWALLNGAEPKLQLTEAEAARALGYADIFLISLTVGWKLPRPDRWRLAPAQPMRIRMPVVVLVSTAALPVGLFFLLTRAYLPGRSVADRQIETSYEILAVTWPGLILLALVYHYGMRWALMAPLSVYLVLMALQGQGRYRVILPAILLLQIWLDRREKRWPSLWAVLGLVALAVVFIPMKSIGLEARAGTLNWSHTTEIISDSTAEAIRGENPQQALFDQYAASITLSNNHGPPMYGRHFIDLLALPIPRPLWPDKPGVAEHLRAISTPSRPLSEMGSILTLPGEIYLDFRVPGLILLGLALARISQRIYLGAYARGYASVYHFTFLLLAASLIQVYRDGLTSVPIFLLVHNAPLVVIAVFCWAVKQAEPQATTPKATRRVT